VVRSERRAAIRSTQTGIKIDAERLARRALHTVVSQRVSACATSPLALRQAPARRPGPACRGSPVHTRSEHTGSSRVGGASRGYSTAARAQVGKSYAPSAPRAGQGTPQREAAEGLRLAVVKQLLPGTDREGRGGEGIEPGAWLSLTEMFVWSEGPRTISPGSRFPKGAVPDPHASRAPPGRLPSCRCC